MKYMTAGELRGASLVAIVDDVPAGLRLQAASIQADLDRWSHGCSCGERREVGAPRFFRAFRRMAAQVRLCRSLSTMRHIERLLKTKRLAKPPFHVLVRLIWRVFWRLMPMIADPSSRALRRSQAALIAASAVAREFWPNSALKSNPYVTRIGAAAMREQSIDFETLRYTPLEIESSPVRCPSAQASRAMEEEIAAARVAGDTLGGEVAVAIHGVAPALGRIAAAA